MTEKTQHGSAGFFHENFFGAYIYYVPFFILRIPPHFLQKAYLPVL